MGRFGRTGSRLGAVLVAMTATMFLGVPSASAEYSDSCAWSAGLFQVEYVHGVKAYTTKGGYMARGMLCQTGKSRLSMQTDGNLVLYDENGVARWAASWSRPNVIGRGAFAYFQNDNNYVLYDNGNPWIAQWASNTYTGQFGGRLAIQADGNLVVYNPNLVPLWATNTAH